MAKSRSSRYVVDERERDSRDAALPPVFPERPAREPSLHGLWEANTSVLTMADDPDTFDQVTGGWPLGAPLCKILKERNT